MKKLLTILALVLPILMSYMVASTAFADDDIYSCDEVSEVPLPASALLFGSGLIGMVAVARRRNDKTDDSANESN